MVSTEFLLILKFNEPAMNFCITSRLLAVERYKRQAAAPALFSEATGILTDQQ